MCIEHVTSRTNDDECFTSGDDSNLRLLLIQRRLQTSGGLLELMVLDGVDERVDTAVNEHQNHGKMVVPACEVKIIAAEETQKDQDFIWCPAHDKSATDHQ